MGVPRILDETDETCISHLNKMRQQKNTWVIDDFSQNMSVSCIFLVTWLGLKKNWKPIDPCFDWKFDLVLEAKNTKIEDLLQ